MIKLITSGSYRLITGKNHQKILYLENQAYIWTYAKNIGDLLTFSKHPHNQEYILAKGKYNLHKVKNEPHLVDLLHLELAVGKKWQGYLLLTGLPTKNKIHSRIVPTDEVIS
ncbi:MAG TPA: hypothetical protein VJH06_04065 [Candidatus Paceibacterota bacterium]